MIIAFIFGLVAGLALLLGAIIGLVFKPAQKISAMIMAFGSGVLISLLHLKTHHMSEHKVSIIKSILYSFLCDQTLPLT